MPYARSIRSRSSCTCDESRLSDPGVSETCLQIAVSRARRAPAHCIGIQTLHRLQQINLPPLGAALRGNLPVLWRVDSSSAQSSSVCGSIAAQGALPFAGNRLEDIGTTTAQESARDALTDAQVVDEGWPPALDEAGDIDVVAAGCR